MHSMKRRKNPISLTPDAQRTWRRGATVVAALIVALSTILAIAAPVSAAVLTNDYPASLRDYPRDSKVDPWNFYNRECTSWVAWRLNHDQEIGFTNSYKQPRGSRWGNAIDWIAAAKRAGILYDTTPAAGSVAWFSVGHVAYVASVKGVSGGTKITIEEYNLHLDGKYTTRILTSGTSEYPNYFIHIADGPSHHTWYSLINVNGKAVDARSGATADGTAVQQYSDNATYAQQWIFGALSSGYTRIGNRNASGQVWTVVGASTADGARIELRAYGTGNNQWWKPIYEGKGYYHFVVRHSGKCLDVPGGSTSESLQLQQYTCNGTSSQSFRLASH